LSDDDEPILCLAGVVQDRCVARETRQAVAQALGDIGPAAEAATVILRQVANDEQDDRLVRESARMALCRIDLPHER
jgi:uncharacterized protein (UPF0147 family)